MSTRADDIPPERLVRKSAEEIAAWARSPEAKDERDRLESMTNEEVTGAALTDPDNPPLTERQLGQMRRGEPVTPDPVGLLLMHLEHGGHSDAELAAAIERIAELLHRRMTAPTVQEQRKAG